jgi:hypothetical protein
MRSMGRLFVAGMLLVLVAAGGALAAELNPANHLDPKRNIRPADQARAQAMVMKKGDVGPGYVVVPSGVDNQGFHCRGFDESDLTLTGKAKSPAFTRGLVALSSAAQVFVSVADANASWRRGTSATGKRCLAETIRRGFAQQGIRLQSMRNLAFPRLSQQTVAYRLVLSVQSANGEVPVIADLVVLLHSRAYVGLFFISGLSPIAKAEEERLARLTARRMATAMRGA